MSLPEESRGHTEEENLLKTSKIDCSRQPRGMSTEKLLDGPPNCRLVRFKPVQGIPSRSLPKETVGGKTATTISIGLSTSEGR